MLLNSPNTPFNCTMKIGNTKVISFINLKGGVGKTTCAVNFAATLATRQTTEGSRVRDNRVLLIDLDPQSNASQTLISREQYEERDAQEKTLFSLFQHELIRHDHNSRSQTFNLDEIRVDSPIKGLRLDLIPSSLKLIDIQDRLVTFRRYYLSATDILYNALHTIEDDEGRKYTHIIIDCPPNLGLITLNGLSLSRYYIVPTFLDAYSHWGLDKIQERVASLRRCKATCNVELLGIIYSKVKTIATIENRRWRDEFDQWANMFRERMNLRHNHPLVFKSEISDSDIVRKAEAANSPVVTFTPEHGRDYARLCEDRDKHKLEWEHFVEEAVERM